MTTKRQKLEAMANQTASPEEAKVAKSMLAKTPEGKLDRIADDIRTEWGKGINSQFTIGRLLSEARSQFEVGREDLQFGAWVAAQKFPFSRQQAWRLRWAAENETEVRAFIEASATTSTRGPDMGVSTAVEYMKRKPKPPAAEALPVTDTTPPDPAYVAMRTAHRLLVEENGFATLHVDDMTKVALFIKALAAAYNAEKGRRGL